jgi:tRNA uridine 5-carbamoylmethylation protein Kti12
MESKLITIIGAPGSGKSTLATDVHTYLKKSGLNSVYIPEVATDFIAECGIPDTPIDQMTIFYKQTNRERMFIGTKEYIICDSSGILNYFYFRRLFQNPLQNKDISIINHLQKEILKTLSQWNFIFYCPVRLENVEDNIRFQNIDEIKKIDRWIKSYLELENIPHIDLSNVDIADRQEYVIKIITKNETSLPSNINPTNT